jgi:hypothetical protein
MRTFINLLVIVSLVSLTGCIPGLFGGTGGQASFQYSSSMGDTNGFALTPFNTSYVNAQPVSSTVRITVQEDSDTPRQLFLDVAGQLAPGFSCPLAQGSLMGVSPSGCTLVYRQLDPQSNESSGKVTITGGTLTVTAYDGQNLSFNFEATLQTPAGGSFTLQGSGSSRIQ